MINGLHHLLPICPKAYKYHTKLRWERRIELYCKTVKTLRFQSWFVWKDICHFHKTADKCCDIKILLTSCDGMTNYLHALRAEHLVYFLLARGNLYCYLQQE